MKVFNPPHLLSPIRPVSRHWQLEFHRPHRRVRPLTLSNSQKILFTQKLLVEERRHTLWHHRDIRKLLRIGESPALCDILLHLKRRCIAPMKIRPDVPDLIHVPYQLIRLCSILLLIRMKIMAPDLLVRIRILRTTPTARTTCLLIQRHRGRFLFLVTEFF